MGAYRDQVVADGAVAYWRLDEASGTTAVDVIGGKNGTISGGVTLGQPGALADGNQAMRFDGSTGKIVTASPIALPVACTLELWIKSAATNANVGVFGNRFTVQDGIVLIALRTPDGGSVYGDSYVGGNNVIHGAVLPNFTDGAWHHVAWVMNGSMGTLYLDGVQNAQQAQPHVALTAPFQLGYDTFQNLYFNGFIDEVAIYPTALTAPQIAQHYALRLATAKPPADLRYRWCRFTRPPFRARRAS
jgi:hypothetical protein